ncbi:copia protein [Lasius niger]|uniref:Copia protein n=1 Tax=Lasius niger TaxID=67767 RepID=A0A0J7K2P4_LASNI|nr:copia protein [Lasius niger]
MEMAETKAFSIHKFNGQNYQLWKRQMEIYMADNKLMPYILGEVARPTVNPEAWLEKDRAAQAFLMRGLELEQLKYITDCKTSAQMWARLQTVHAEKSDQSMQVLLDRFINCKMGEEESIADYIARMTGLAQRLKDMDLEQKDPVVIAKILGSLPARYDNIRTAWYTVPRTDQTIERLTDHLINEETLLNLRSRSENHASEALATNAKKNFNGKPATAYDKNCHSKEAEDTWYADSGATEHMSFCRHWFKNFKQYSENTYTVRVGDGTHINARERGNIDVKMNYADGTTAVYTMTNVLYVPKLRKNLLSIIKTTDRGIKVTFLKGGNRVLFEKNQQLIVDGVRSDNLYRLNMKPLHAAEAQLSKTNVLENLKQFYAEVKADGYQIKKLRTDNGLEFCNVEVYEFLREKSIKHETSTPRAPEQNGFIERQNRTIVESAKSMMHSRNIPRCLWAEAANTAVYVKNRTASETLGGSTPFEKWFGEKPSVKHLKIFGSDCYVHVPKDQRTK